MFTLSLALFLTTAPIPKSTYEGQIAVVVRKAQLAEIVLLNPAGQEVKRVPLKDLNGIAYTVKLSHGSDYALVTTSNGSIAVGNMNFAGNGGYFIKLDGTEKPKELFERKASVKWVLNRDATHAYGTEIDEEKAKKNLNTAPYQFRAWNLDLKSFKFESIPLPSDHQFIDITQDDKTALTWCIAKGQYRSATVPTATWKPTNIAETMDYPHGISPDGKHVFLMEYSQQGVPRTSNRLVLHDLATKERKTIPQPEECNSVSAFSYGADGKRLAFVGYSQEPVVNGVTVVYRLYVSNTDGSNRKMIFETKPGESISDIDWR